jgi:hypothetical protein
MCLFNEWGGWTTTLNMVFSVMWHSMVTFWMKLLMNKWKNIVADDG